MPSGSNQPAMDQGSTMADATATGSTPPQAPLPEPKRHAACDECRLRKLKCSGTRPACERCAREHIACVYSPQKQMGRPRKRRRDEGGATTAVDTTIPATEAVLINAPSSSAVSPSPLTAHMDNGILLSGFGGFDFAAGGDGVGDGGVFDLDPNFNLDPLLGMMNDVENGVSEHSNSAPVSSPSHSHSGHSFHDSTPSHHSLHSDANSQRPFLSPPIGPPCACLSNVYLTMSSIHSIATWDFPFVLPSLRTAMGTATSMLDCPHCPKTVSTAGQNLHMLISLLMTLVDSMHKVLVTIDNEATRVDAVGEKKQFMMADASAPASMHTGRPDCPVKFGMEMTGQEWRELARKVVKTQLIGSADQEQEGTMYGIVAAMHRRQNRWHEDPSMFEMRAKIYGEELVRMSDRDPHMRLCGKNVQAIRFALDRLAI